MSKFPKRLTALLLSGMLVIGLAPVGVFAEDFGQTSEAAVEEAASEEAVAAETEGEVAAGNIAAPEEEDQALTGTTEAPEEVVGDQEATGTTDAPAEEVAQYYTVTLNANGGYFENEWDDALGEYVEQVETISKAVPIGDAIVTFPVFGEDDQESQSMIFAGWSLEPDGQLISEGFEEYLPEDNCTIYALWEINPSAVSETAEEDDDIDSADNPGQDEDLEEIAETDPAQIPDDTEKAEEKEQSSNEDKKEAFDYNEAGNETSAAGGTEEAEAANTDDTYKREPDSENESLNDSEEGGSHDSFDLARFEQAPEEAQSSPDAEDTTLVDDPTEEEITETAKEASGDLTYENFTYTVSGSNATITGYTSSAASLTMPSKIGEYTVTAIKDYAFSDCSSLTSLTLPESITVIGSYFIEGTGIKSITIPKNVTSCAYCLTGSVVEDVVFEEGMTKIPNKACMQYNDSYINYTTRVQIPESITTIGSSAFSGCAELTEVSIPKAVSTVQNYAFSGCTGLQSVQFNYNDEIVITAGNIRQPYSLTIGSCAFSNCSSLSHVELTENVTEIQDYAFSDCSSLTSLTLPESITVIGSYFIEGTGIKSITIPKNVTSCAYCLTGSVVEDVVFEGGMTKIPNKACMQYNDSFINYAAKVQIPESITAIGDSAFVGCAELTEVNIPQAVTSIGSSAFNGCTGLKEIDIPRKVSTVGNYAFSGCTGLQSVQFNYNDEIVITAGNIRRPYSLTIGSCAFSNCSSLSHVELTENVTEIQDYAFSACSSLTSLTLPESITVIGSYFIEGTGIKSITIPKNVTSCAYCLTGSVVEDVVFEEGMTKIPNKACMQYNDSYINYTTRVQIPESITTIGSSAFSGCAELTEVSIPKAVSTVQNYAFSGCTGLQSVQFNYNDEIVITAGNIRQPYSLTIGSCAFSNCSSLSHVELTENVTEIQDYAFSDCSSLTSLTLPESITVIGSYFIEGTGIKSITIPKNVTSCAYCLTGSVVEDVVFEGGMTKIPNKACMQYNDSFINYAAKVQIPESVTTFGSSAFAGCIYLTDIYYGAGEEDWNRISGIDQISDTVTIHYNSAGLTGLSISPPDIKVQVGKKITVQACGKNGQDIASAGTARWTIENCETGKAKISRLSGVNGRSFCEITGVESGICSVTVTMSGGRSATADITVIDEDKNVVSVGGTQTHLSGSQNYTLEDSENGELDVTDPITSTVEIKRISTYTANKTITIKKNGILHVKGILNAQKINIKAGGQLHIDGGRVNATDVTAEGGTWFSADPGGKIRVENGALKAENIKVKGAGNCEIAMNDDQIIATNSFVYKGDSYNILQGYLYIGKSLEVSENFRGISLKTVFYGDTTKGKFKFDKESNIGTVYAEDSDAFDMVGAGDQNYVTALQHMGVVQSETEKWRLKRESVPEKLSSAWAETLGAYYKNLIRNSQTAALLSYYPGFTSEDCEFVTRLALIWVGSVQPQINRGLLEITEQKYDMYFELHGKKYRIRYNPTTYGNYAVFGQVILSDKDGDNPQIFGTKAGGSTVNFQAQAATYLAETYVKEYYKFVTGAVPSRTYNEDTIKGIIKKHADKYAKTYFEKMINKYLFGTMYETKTKEIKRIENSFKLQKVLWDGDLSGIWGVVSNSIKEKMKGAVKKGVSGSVMHEEEESEELQPEEPQSGIESVTETPKFTEVSDTVTDEFLKEALIELLGSDSNGEPDFSKEHEVTFLDLSGRFIQRLDGLQHLKSLQTLILDDNEISDLSPLSSLTRLKYLDVSGQNVEDILALSGLSGLEYLDISDNPVSSLAAVSGFAALKELDITDTGVTSLSPLSSLERLKSLRAANAQLNDSDLSALSGMSRLEELDLTSCGIQTLEGLNVENLTSLYVRDNQLTDMSQLSTASKLVTLDISGNMLETVPSLKECTGLKTLSLSGNMLVNMDGLAEAEALTELNLSACELMDSDLAILSQFQALETLDLSFNNMSDIAVLFENTGLKTVDISYTDVDVADYSDLPTKITFTDSRIVDSGTCRDGLRWIINESGRLTILGKGQMRSYGNDDVPWPEAETVRIGEGITSIGSYAFMGSGALSRVILPSSLTSIGEAAFRGCSELTDIVIPSGVSSLGSRALYNGEMTIVFLGSEETWNSISAGKGLQYGEVLFSMYNLPEDFTLSKTSYTYTGKKCTPEVTVTRNGETLTEGNDYTVAYDNNLNAGTAAVTVTGTGLYVGLVTKTFTISKAAQSITASDMSLTYLKSGTISASGNKGKLTYKSDNTAVAAVDSAGKVTAKGAGTAKITITAAATSNYKSATKKITVKIAKATQSITAKIGASSVAVGKTTTVSVTGVKGSKSYKSSDTTIATVTSAGKVTAKKVGTVKITATSAATANYNAASKIVTVKVVPAATASISTTNQAKGIKLTWKKVTGATGFLVYRGSTKIATIKSGSTVTYTDSKANTNGTKYIYKIIPTALTGNGPAKSVTTYCVARPAISSVTNSASKRMTVKWGKNAKASGYQIHYCTDKTFKSGNKSVNIKGAGTVAKAIASLTKGKTYYVRIRTYKTVGSTKCFSGWSAVKSVKISK